MNTDRNDEHLLNGDEDDTDYDLDEREEALLLDEEYDNNLPCVEELNEADNQSSDANKCKREGKFTTERKVITAPTTNAVSNTIPDTLDQVNIDITQIRNFKQKQNKKPFVRGRRNGFNRYDSQQKNWRDKRDSNANRTVHINPHFSGMSSPWEAQQAPNQFPNNQLLQPWTQNVFTQITPTMNSNFPVLNQQQYPPYNNYTSLPFVESSMPPIVHMDRPPVPENNTMLQNPPIPHSQMMNHGNGFFSQTCRVQVPPIPAFQNHPYPNTMHPIQNMDPLQNMYQPCQVPPDSPQLVSDTTHMYQPQLGFNNQESRPIDFQIQLTTHNNLPVHQRLGAGRRVSMMHRRNPAFYHARDKQQHQNGKQMEESHKQLHNSPNKILSDNGKSTDWKNNCNQKAFKMEYKHNIEIVSQSNTESPLITCVTNESFDDEDEETKNYRLKIEEQKRRREEILQRKEERRKMAAVQNSEFETNVTTNPPRNNAQQFSFTKTRPQRNPRSITTNPNITRIVPISNIKIIVPSESSHIAVKTTNSLLNDITINTGPLSRKISVKPQSNITANVNHFSVADQQLVETRSVSIKNLSANTKERKLIAMCRGVGDVQKLQLDKQKRQATIEFKSVAAAHSFFKKYQRHMLDLSVIEVFLLPMT